MPPIGRHGWNPRVNFDGLLFSTPTSSGEATAYAQLFRNGVIEAVDCANLTPPRHLPKGTENCIPSGLYEKEIEAVNGYIKFYSEYEIPTPILVALSILNVKGFYMATRDIFRGGRRIDRDHLILPDRLAESLGLDAAVLLRPSFDQVWNACGHDRSLNYDEKGNWNPAR